MSTYLLAIVISNFKYIDGHSDKGVLIEIAARPEAILNGEGEFALEVTKIDIDFFADYFEIEYPLYKSSDLI